MLVIFAASICKNMMTEAVFCFCCVAIKTYYFAVNGKLKSFAVISFCSHNFLNFIMLYNKGIIREPEPAPRDLFNRRV